MVEIIVIGGSAGALDALSTILGELPATFNLPLLLVLHLPPDRPSYLAQVLALHTQLKVKEAEDKEPARPGTLYVAPANYHLLLERGGVLSLSADDVVLFSRPSIDVLFESAADSYGERAMGVLLTGANEDGARGLASIRSAGGKTLVQSPATARVSAMPEAALRVNPDHHVLPLGEMGAFLAHFDTPTPSRLLAP